MQEGEQDPELDAELQSSAPGSPQLHPSGSGSSIATIFRGSQSPPETLFPQAGAGGRPGPIRAPLPLPSSPHSLRLQDPMYPQQGHCHPFSWNDPCFAPASLSPQPLQQGHFDQCLARVDQPLQQHPEQLGSSSISDIQDALDGDVGLTWDSHHTPFLGNPADFQQLGQSADPSCPEGHADLHMLQQLLLNVPGAPSFPSAAQQLTKKQAGSDVHFWDLDSESGQAGTLPGQFDAGLPTMTHHQLQSAHLQPSNLQPTHFQLPQDADFGSPFQPVGCYKPTFSADGNVGHIGLSTVGPAGASPDLGGPILRGRVLAPEFQPDLPAFCGPGPPCLM